MPENKLSSAFIWYHAPSEQASAFHAWLSDIKNTLHIHGQLYQRIQNEKTTFMEVFEHVDSATIEKIEQLATQQHCFHGIERRCESFERIPTL